MKSIDKENSKEIIKIGVSLILAGGIVALVVLINFYMAAQMSQTQAMSANNAQRLVQIESFINQQMQAAQQQAPNGEQADTVNKK